MAPQRAEVLLMAWLRWAATACLQWAVTRWVTHLVAEPQWVVIRRVVIRWAALQGLMVQWQRWMVLRRRRANLQRRPQRVGHLVGDDFQ